MRLPFFLPARLLASGEYVLALSGLNANGEADALSKTIFLVKKNNPPGNLSRSMPRTR